MDDVTIASRTWESTQPFASWSRPCGPIGFFSLSPDLLSARCILIGKFREFATDQLVSEKGARQSVRSGAGQANRAHAWRVILEHELAASAAPVASVVRLVPRQEMTQNLSDTSLHFSPGSRASAFRIALCASDALVLHRSSGSFGRHQLPHCPASVDRIGVGQKSIPCVLTSWAPVAHSLACPSARPFCPSTCQC